MAMPKAYPFSSNVRVLAEEGVAEYAFSAAPAEDGGNVGASDAPRGLRLYLRSSARAGVGAGRARRPVGPGDRVLRGLRRAGPRARAGHRRAGACRARRLARRRALARERAPRRRFVTDVVCLGILVADVVARPVDGVPRRRHARARRLDRPPRRRLRAQHLERARAARAPRRRARQGRRATPSGDFVVALLDERGVDRSLVSCATRSLPTSASVALVDSAG